MASQAVTPATDAAVPGAARQHYLDWLRVIAIFGVFLFHVALIFNEVPNDIKNAERSEGLTTLCAFFFPWGIPLVFLIAGASSCLALQRRTPRRYGRERFSRLLIPFVAGSLLLSPLRLYVEWRHGLQTGVVLGSLWAYVQAQQWELSPRVFAAIGEHLWFLAFLFCYSLLTLPLFGWLKTATGQRWVARLAQLCERRGGIILFVIPLLVVRLGLQPFFPQYLNWTDFAAFLTFFVLGYVLFADPRFIPAMRRDWLITLAIGTAAFLAGLAISVVTDEFDLELVPRAPWEWAWWAAFTICSWCWTVVVLGAGVRFLNFSNRWLQYGQEAVMPFYVLHLPVILVIAYFVVQWPLGLWPKLLILGVSALAVTLGLTELIIKRVGLLRAGFGMPADRPLRRKSLPAGAPGHG